MVDVVQTRVLTGLCQCAPLFELTLPGSQTVLKKAVETVLAIRGDLLKHLFELLTGFLQLAGADLLALLNLGGAPARRGGDFIPYLLRCQRATVTDQADFAFEQQTHDQQHGFPFRPTIGPTTVVGLR